MGITNIENGLNSIERHTNLGICIMEETEKRSFLIYLQRILYRKAAGITKILRELCRNGSPLGSIRVSRLNTKTSLKKMSEVLSEVLSKKDYEKVKAIIDFIDEYGEISPKEAENITKKSAATVRRYLKMLVDTERIVAEGSTNNAKYRISQSMTDNK